MDDSCRHSGLFLNPASLCLVVLTQESFYQESFRQQSFCLSYSASITIVAPQQENNACLNG